MSIHGLKKKKKRITQHLNKIKDRRDLRDHMDEQKSVISTINRKIRTIKKEGEKKDATR